MKKGVKRPIYKKDKIEQSFNLKTLLGYEPNAEQKEAFYELAVDRIQERTTGGHDINGKKFKQYTEGYAQTKGVKRTAVDLVLEGDMLQAFDDESRQRNMVKIALESQETKKAYNHNVGDTLPKRTFFGVIKDKEIKKIINMVDSLRIPDEDIEQVDAIEPEFDLAALRAAIESVEVI